MLMWIEWGAIYVFIIKPTRCTDFSNLFLEKNSTCFGQFLCPSSGVFHRTHSNGICHTGVLTARKLSEHLYDKHHCCVYNKTLLMIDRGTLRNMYSQNKFEKLVNIVGFIIRIYHDARSDESHNLHTCLFVYIYIPKYKQRKTHVHTHMRAPTHTHNN